MTYQLDSWLKKKNTQRLRWQKAEKLESCKSTDERELNLQKGEKKFLETINDSQNICDMGL